jgi:predicted esterase
MIHGDFGWWHSASDGGGAAPRCHGWARSRDFLVALRAQAGPFHGLFGFSQGAAAVALLAGLGALAGDPPGFAIMVGGFTTGDPEHAPLYAALAEAAIPSLHIIGRSDTIVAPRASRALAARFSRPLICEHDGGHVIAATPAIQRASRQLLDAMAQAHTTIIKKTLV